MTASASEPWLRFEDEHLLAVGKPAGVNTHRADALAQDGMYEWVQRQRPGVALSILHRLDKATSGLLLFGRSTAANQALAAQFGERSVAKQYELLVARDDRRPDAQRCDEPIPAGRPGAPPLDASTDFAREATGPALELVTARPHTGRTHQVRRHAAALGMPIVGDHEHSGIEAPRLFLHAASLRIDHPSSGALDLRVPRPATFDEALGVEGADGLRAPALAARVALEARAALFDPADTDCYLWVDRHHDGWPGVRVERLGDVALILDYEGSADAVSAAWVAALSDALPATAVYEQLRPRGGGGGPARRRAGREGPRFEVTELGRRYLIDLEASATSSGLFLDQRETRRALLARDLRGRTVLNVFAHTGSLSVAAATAGAETLTLDLSRRYLDWARDNLRANDIDPADHDFIYGDALEWMARLARKGRTFDVVLIDPPSSSTTGKRGRTRWVAERDLHDVVRRGAELTAREGTMFVSTNLRRMPWPAFLHHVEQGLAAADRTGTLETQTLPLDHRSGPGDPPYLKAAWIRLDPA